MLQAPIINTATTAAHESFMSNQKKLHRNGKNTHRCRTNSREAVFQRRRSGQRSLDSVHTVGTTRHSRNAPRVCAAFEQFKTCSSHLVNSMNSFHI